MEKETRLLGGSMGEVRVYSKEGEAFGVDTVYKVVIIAVVGKIGKPPPS